jgi:FkbH-like protein
MKQFQGLCLSSFNLGTFVQLLNCDDTLPVIQAQAGEYGQWFVLSNEQQGADGEAFDFMVVWTMPEHISPAFGKFLQFEPVSHDALMQDVDNFCQAILRMSSRATLTFVPLWLVSPQNCGLGALDMAMESGVNRALMEMNARLCRNLDGKRGVYALNSSRWLVRTGVRGFQSKSWFTTKNPFNNDIYGEALRDIKTALLGSIGKIRKLIVVDLDETLWGGIVGEVGWKNIRLGGHDYVGEALQDFQRALKALKNRGVLLAIASKNDEKTAMEAIQQHPEMILKQVDFVGWRINWQDKAENIADLARKLNLGLDSVVFIDDSEFERRRVRDALPEVLVPEWPTDKTQYISHLMGLRCFESLQMSAEDVARTKMYHEEQSRNLVRKEYVSLDEWLAASDLAITVKKLDEVDLPRVVQLINKTNQMNLTTRRLNEQELQQWLDTTGAALWSIRVADRFGDSGLCGVISAMIAPQMDDTVRIVDFILSCRVLGRKVEDVMLHVAVNWALAQQKAKVVATHVPTERNGVCRDFWMNSGCERVAADNTFVWPSEKMHTLPSFIKVHGIQPEKTAIPAGE